MLGILDRHRAHDSRWKRELCWLAEGVGFEPTRRSSRLRDFQSRALGQLCDPSVWKAEGVGFEPTRAHRPTAFRERHHKPLGHPSALSRAMQGVGPALFRYARRDSNPRPFGPQPNALSSELRALALSCRFRRPSSHRLQYSTAPVLRATIGPARPLSPVPLNRGKHRPQGNRGDNITYPPVGNSTGLAVTSHWARPDPGSA